MRQPQRTTDHLGEQDPIGLSTPLRQHEPTPSDGPRGSRDGPRGVTVGPDASTSVRPVVLVLVLVVVLVKRIV